MDGSFELVAHTADVKLRVKGSSYRSLFVQMVRGMSHYLCANAIATIESESTCMILPVLRNTHESGRDATALVVNFLSEVLYLCDRYNEVYWYVTVNNCTQQSISATLYGISTAGRNVQDIKAVTFHDLILEESATGWIAEVLFDI